MVPSAGSAMNLAQRIACCEGREKSVGTRIVLRRSRSPSAGLRVRLFAAFRVPAIGERSIPMPHIQARTFAGARRGLLKTVHFLRGMRQPAGAIRKSIE